MDSADISNVKLRKTLIAAIELLVGPEDRDRCIENALEERLIRERQRRALDQAAGILDLAEYPEWDTPEKISAWVRSVREEADARTDEKVNRSDR